MSLSENCFAKYTKKEAEIVWRLERVIEKEVGSILFYRDENGEHQKCDCIQIDDVFYSRKDINFNDIKDVLFFVSFNSKTYMEIFDFNMFCFLKKAIKW